jgi:hypothetical protein
MMSWDPGSLSLFLALEEKKSGDDNEPLSSLLSFALEVKNIEIDNEPLGSLSSFATETKQPKTMMSRDPGSLSFSALEEKTNI